jgi:DNA-3-methyladenine glycosylase II
MAITEAVTLYLPVASPFDFGQSLSVLEGPAPCARGRVRRGEELLTGGYAPEPFVARVRPDGRAGVVASVTWLDDAGDTDAVVRRLDGSLSLSEDLSPLYDAAADDPPFARVVADLSGYHPLRFRTPFEAACRAIRSRRPSLSSTDRVRSLVEAAGTVARVDGRELELFPTPEMILAAGDDVRESLRGDAPAVLALAEAFASEDLAALDAGPLVGRLEGLPGVDRAAAAFVARRGFGRRSVLPAGARPGARGFRAAVASLYALDSPATDADLDRLSDPYGEYRGYWAHYVRVWSLRSRD